jgi:hypothetical protein
MSFPDSNSIACDRLLSISDLVPKASGHLLLGRRGDYLAGVSLAPGHRIPFWNLSGFGSSVRFVKDFVHISMSNWELEESDEIQFRRFGFLIYCDDSQLELARNFGFVVFWNHEIE